MGTWLQKRLESLLDNIIFSALLAGGLAVWAIVSRLSGPIIGVVFLGAVAAILLILGQIRSWISRPNTSKPAPEPGVARTPEMAEQKYIPDSYIRGRLINLLDLLPPGGAPIISNRTIEDCEIRGPAMIVILGPVTISGANFDGDINSLFVDVPPNRQIVGAIGLRDCVFRRCRFTAIGIIGTKEEIDNAKKGFILINPKRPQ